MFFKQMLAKTPYKSLVSLAKSWRLVSVSVCRCTKESSSNSECCHEQCVAASTYTVCMNEKGAMLLLLHIMTIAQCTQMLLWDRVACLP